MVRVNISVRVRVRVRGMLSLQTGIVVWAGFVLEADVWVAVGICVSTDVGFWVGSRFG